MAKYYSFTLKNIPGLKKLNTEAQDIVRENKNPGMLERDYLGGTSIAGDCGHTKPFEAIKFPFPEELIPWMKNLVMQPVIATVTAFYNNYFSFREAIPTTVRSQYIRVHPDGTVKVFLAFSEFVDMDRSQMLSLDKNGALHATELGDTCKEPLHPDDTKVPLLCFELTYKFNPGDIRPVALSTFALMHDQLAFRLKPEENPIDMHGLVRTKRAREHTSGPYGVIDEMLKRVLFEAEYVPGNYKPDYCGVLDPHNDAEGAVVVGSDEEVEALILSNDGWVTGGLNKEEIEAQVPGLRQRAKPTSP